jgi:chromosome segregation ATPase
MQVRGMKSFIVAVTTSGALAVDSNPMAKVIELMDGLAAKVTADGEAAAKTYKEYFEWCDDSAKNTQFAIKTATSEVEELEAKIAELTATIETASGKIEDLSGAIASDEKELKEATAIREKELSDFQKSEAELMDTVDTLGRAVGILEKELSKNAGAFAQIDTSNMKALASALGAIVDGAAFAGVGVNKQKLMALVQAQQSDQDDDLDMGAPAAAVYESKAGSIVDVLADMKDKADGELTDLRKAESNTAHNFNMLKQSLEDQISADTKSMEELKAKKSSAEEEKATAEGDLSVASKDLAAAQDELSTLHSDCLTTAADYEATVTSRKEELAVIAKAKKILEETSSGAVKQSYDFLQLSAASKNSQVVTSIKALAKKHHSAALAQLASRVQAVVKYGGGADVFAKIKGLVADMIAKLEKEAAEDAEEKAYCDEEMKKTEAKKAELEEDLAKVTAKLEQAAANSAKLKEEVKVAQQQLADLAKETAEMNKIRSEENAHYIEATTDLKAGLGGVQKALGVLRDYYENSGASLMQEVGTSMMQQPAAPEKHGASGGAGGSIISILEVCESDFSDNLAKEEAAESDSVALYEKTTQENKVTKTTLDQDVKYKTQEFKGLDAAIVEHTADKDTLNTEYSAVMDYYAQIKDRCIAKPESYEDRKARREAEIDGLKQALQVLEDETAFVQRKRRGVRGAMEA